MFAKSTRANVVVAKPGLTTMRPLIVIYVRLLQPNVELWLAIRFKTTKKVTRRQKESMKLIVLTLTFRMSETD